MNKEKLIKSWNWLLRDPKRFRHITLECSTACNRNCSWCNLSKLPRRPNQYLECAPQIIEELGRHLYIGSICWNWMNEPLMYEGLMDLMKYARKKLLLARFQILTNGDYLFGNLEKWMQVTNTMDISVHPNPQTQWVKDLERLPDKVRQRVCVVICTPSSLQSRCGVVESKHPVRTCCDMMGIATVAADGYMPICCNDYQYKRTPETNIAKLGIFGAYRMMQDIHKSIEQWHYPPNICKTCTPGAALTIHADDFLAVHRKHGWQTADWDGWDKAITDGTIKWRRNIGTIHDVCGYTDKIEKTKKQNKG